MKKLISLFIVFATFLGVTLGKTVYVNANHPSNGDGTSWSSPYTNLQTAVTAAVAGDLVLVTNGVYSPISTGNKAITIQSVEGSSVTSIDGGGTTRCATLGTGVVLKGFTLFNGYTTGNGGGIYGGNIYDSIIENNVSASSGGGIYNATMVSNCVVRYNTMSAFLFNQGVGGGGVYGGSNSQIMDSEVYGNIATNGQYHKGGGIYGLKIIRCSVYENLGMQGGGIGNAEVYDSIIVSNTAFWGGGGYWADSASRVFTNNIVAFNRAPSGGGVNNGKISSSVIYSNTANNSGGGSYGGTLTGCVISNNVTTLYDGGGSYNSALTDCTVSGNTANRNGGGSSSGTLTDCTVSGNTANNSGGGSYGGTLTDCTISGNTANFDGGGSNGGTLTDCTISGNTANRNGGGSSSGTLTDCMIYGNTANQRGGGFFYSTLFNSVISNNIAVVNGGGGYNGRINSCLVVGNIAPIGSQIRNQDNNFYAYNSTIIGECSFANTTQDIFNNIFYGANITFPPTAQVGFNTFSGTLTGGTIIGPNLSSTDPQFTDPANSDFTLLPTSPCINKGANQYVVTETDLLGRPRIMDWRVDMGAYESQSTRFVTTPNALYPMGTRDVK